MEKDLLTGSICLSDIPKELIKKVQCKDGKTRMYLNVAVIPRKEPQTFGDRTYTHFMSCAPKKEERKDGVNYYIADFAVYEKKMNIPSPQDIDNAPAVTADDMDDLPF